MRWNEIISEDLDEANKPITLPDWSNREHHGWYAVFANPEGEEAKLYRSEHGKYIADVVGRYDVTVNSLEELQNRMEKDGFTEFVGIDDD